MVARLNDIAARAQAQLAQPKIFFTVAFVIAFALSLARALMPFTSPFDEHTHLSYVQYAFNWQIPAEGYPMNTWAKDAFSCYAHALYGRLTDVPCGVHADGALYPTGGTNTSQIWPPLYFIIVALFMRIPMLAGLDPLMSARMVTVILWSLGTAWLGLVTWRKSKHLALSLGVVALLVALPTFFFYSSFVSPHSLAPLIAATVIVLADKFISSAKNHYKLNEIHTFWSGLQSGFTNKWGYSLVALSVLVAFAVPQALTVVGFGTIYIILNLVFSKWRSYPGWLTAYTFMVGLFGLASTIVFFGIYKFWQWQKDFRAIPISSGVDPTRANVDLPDAAYTSVLEQVSSVWWNFWPKGLVPEAPAGPDGTALIYPWFLLLTCLSIAAILFWKNREWLGKMMLALFIAAPVFSVLYEFIFTTGVPIRYGLLFPIIGVLAIANRSISRWPRRVLLVLVALTYVSAFAMNYMFVYRTCGLDPATQLITCS